MNASILAAARGLDLRHPCHYAVSHNGRKKWDYPMTHVYLCFPKGHSDKIHMATGMAYFTLRFLQRYLMLGKIPSRWLLFELNNRPHHTPSSRFLDSLHGLHHPPEIPCALQMCHIHVITNFLGHHLGVIFEMICICYAPLQRELYLCKLAKLWTHGALVSVTCFEWWLNVTYHWSGSALTV